MARIHKVGGVAVPLANPSELTVFQEQAAYRLETFMAANRLPAREAHCREKLLDALGGWPASWGRVLYSARTSVSQEATAAIQKQ